MNHSRSATLVWTREVGPSIFHQRFAESAIAHQAHAGQFVHLLPGPKHFFRRAFSIYATDAKAGTFDILHQALGEGTRCLSRLKKGDAVDTLGPLGNRFPRPARGRRPVLVGGGLGMAPLRLWATELCQPLPTGRRDDKAHDRLPLMLLGVRSNSLAVPPLGLAPMGLRILWASDDGSRGFHGNVVALMDEQIAHGGVVAERSTVYGCGPEPMMASLVQLCREHAIPCAVSLERSMPCGYGVCMGCVVRVKDGNGYETYKRVCRDGPIFDSEKIIF